MQSSDNYIYLQPFEHSPAFKISKPKFFLTDDAYIYLTSD